MFANHQLQNKELEKKERGYYNFSFLSHFITVRVHLVVTTFFSPLCCHCCFVATSLNALRCFNTSKNSCTLNDASSVLTLSNIRACNCTRSLLLLLARLQSPITATKVLGTVKNDTNSPVSTTSLHPSNSKITIFSAGLNSATLEVHKC